MILKETTKRGHLDTMNNFECFSFAEIVLPDINTVHFQLNRASTAFTVVEIRRLLERTINDCFNNTLSILAVAFSCGIESLDGVIKREPATGMRTGNITGKELETYRCVTNGLRSIFPLATKEMARG